MERFLILDKYNTWYDWHLILSAKEYTPPEIKTNTVDIDGMNGSLDLTEALTGEPTYKDGEFNATLWTDYGKRQDREDLFKSIIKAVHGRKIRLIEPDNPNHYLVGRITVGDKENNLAYMSFKIKVTCEPWLYAIEETTRLITLAKADADIVLINNGVKTLCPTITVNGKATITIDGFAPIELITGVHIISDLKLKQGATVVKVSGSGTVTFTYREAEF